MSVSTLSQFPHLLLGSLHLLTRQWKSVLIGAVSFAMMMAVVSAFVDRRIDTIEQELASVLQISPEELQVLAEKQLVALGAGDMGPVLLELQSFEQSGAPLDLEHAGMVYGLRAGPYILLFLLILQVALFIAGIFYLLLFSHPIESAFEVFQRLLRSLLPMIGLFFWMLVRSLIWIPFVGPVIALYLLPRLSLAPVVLASGEAGVFQSLHVSMKRTSHRWVSLFFLYLGFFFLLFLLAYFALVIAGIISLFSLKIGFFLWLVGLMLLVALGAAFLTMLSASLG